MFSKLSVASYIARSDWLKCYGKVKEWTMSSELQSNSGYTRIVGEHERSVRDARGVYT